MLLPIEPITFEPVHVKGNILVNHRKHERKWFDTEGWGPILCV